MGANILVVEDNADIREVIGLVLELEYYSVELCEDAACFRRKMWSIGPDLVILDVMLPDGNGIDLCREIKSDVRSGHVPVLMMSAHASLEDINSRCQADDFIPKPFDISNLLDKVSTLSKSTKTS